MARLPGFSGAAAGRRALERRSDVVRLLDVLAVGAEGLGHAVVAEVAEVAARLVPLRIAGPAAATIMSDFGADVIKVEPPGPGDPWRGRGPLPGRTVDYYWQLTSRNKRSLALDLEKPEGRDALLRLVKSADVFVTNYQACLGPLRSLIAQGAFAGVGPFGEHFTGQVDPGAHYGSVGEAAFLLQVLGLEPGACATLVG